MEKVMENLVPTKFKLNQNYPNPFKERTTIKYCVPDKARIGLEVTDSYRNKVKTLVKEIKEAGTYKVEFSAIGGSASGGNAWNLASGIYFYTISARAFTRTKKMVVLK
ncbi:MAG: hypothetical protein DRQ01_09315 [Ignavibacteriae bacterium]|nr:MAG: hypothetical protein DRQ01_09315 [Ignavibacteriota bacterium]